MRRLWKHRYLIGSFTRRQFQIRYRQSALGIVWAFIVPVATLGAGILVFKEIAGVDTGETGYELSTLAGLVPWAFFAGSLAFGVASVVQDKAMVTKLAFPRAVLPLGMIGVSFLDFAIALGIFVGLALILGEGIPLTALWLPLILLVEVVLVAGLVFLGAALNVFVRDVRLIVPLMVQFWLLLTPVLYPLSEAPEGIRSFLMLNPMTGVVLSARGALLSTEPLDLMLLLPAAIGAVAILVLGAWYFSSTEHRFADVV